MISNNLDFEIVNILIKKLLITDMRSKSLHSIFLINYKIVLALNRHNIKNLGLLLWYSDGIIAALIHELVSCYPLLLSNNFSPNIAKRICDCMELLDCIADNPHTQPLFLDANIPVYLFPFLNTSSKSSSLHYLRLMSLSVIGTLSKNSNDKTVVYLLQTDIIPIMLFLLENEQELIQIVLLLLYIRCLYLYFKR